LNILFCKGKNIFAVRNQKKFPLFIQFIAKHDHWN
jgi:hypothetical protein